MSAVLEALAKAMSKAVGDDFVEEKLVYLDTGFPPLNYIVSGKYDGGFPAGKIYEISGPSSSGKTAIATDMMVSAQKQGGYAIFIDWEHSFSIDLAEQFGLDVSPQRFAYHRADTWESGNSKAMELAKIIRDSGAINEDAPIVIVLDSIAAAIPQSMLYDAKGNEREIDSFTMNDTSALSRVTSTTLKVTKRLVDRHKATMFYLNQTRTKIGVVFGDPTTTPGGSAMEFYADGRIRLGRSQIKDKTSKEFLGQDISAKAIKSKFTAPFKSCDLRLMFSGEAAVFDKATSCIEELLKIGIFTKDGHSIVWTDGSKHTVTALAKKINDEGKYSELVALFPTEV